MNSHRLPRSLPSLVLAVSLGLGGATICRAENPFHGIFSDEEYQRAGLGKLSPEEQAELLRALHRLGVSARKQAAIENFGKPPPPPPASVPPPAGTPAPAPTAEKKSLWARIKDFGAEQLPVKNEKDEGEVIELEAQMTEPFRGLRGKTLFHLDNGQVWQQRIAEDYYIGTPIPNPKVTLRRTRFGYRMKIPAVAPGFDISVKRVQ
jgi:hypothetical protein